MLDLNRRIHTLEDLERAFFEVESNQLQKAQEIIELRGNFSEELKEKTKNALVSQIESILESNYILPDEYVIYEFDEIEDPMSFYLKQGMSKKVREPLLSEVIRIDRESENTKSVVESFLERDHFEYKNMMDSIKMMGCETDCSLIVESKTTSKPIGDENFFAPYQTTNLFFKEHIRNIVLTIKREEALNLNDLNFISIKIYECDISDYIMMEMNYHYYDSDINHTCEKLLSEARLQFNSMVFYYIKEFMETGKIEIEKSESMFEKYQLEKFKQTLIDEGIVSDVSKVFNRKKK